MKGLPQSLAFAAALDVFCDCGAPLECAYLAAHFYCSVFSEVPRALLAAPLKKQVLK